jgi:AraC-like DNA-binding protein
MKAASRATLVEQVEAYVRGAISSGHCTTARCAKKLGISVRTLQWRLAESGLKFSDILEGQRIELARDCLLREHFKLEEIAVLLGYSEQASFGRAFKRWTGFTPWAFRSVERPSSSVQVSGTAIAGHVMTWKPYERGRH